MARLAKSLADLRAEFDALFPARSKISDGWIGDAAHASRPSRHNPNSRDVVTALDVTHHPASGCDVHRIARWLADHPHPNLDYIISNRQKAGRSTGWGWRYYGGSNPHTNHAHFGVGVGFDGNPKPPYDDRTPWLLAEAAAALGLIAGTRPAPADTSLDLSEDTMASAPPPEVKQGSKGQWVRNAQALLVAHGNSLAVDGVFGPQTTHVVKQWQARTGVLRADGVIGPKTWQWLTGIPLQGGAP